MLLADSQLRTPLTSTCFGSTRSPGPSVIAVVSWGVSEGALAAVRTLGVSGDPPGDNCNHQEASRKEQKLPRGLWDLLRTIKKPWKTGLVLAAKLLSGSWAVSVGASWDGAPVFDHQQLPRCRRGVRAVQQHPLRPDLLHPEPSAVSCDLLSDQYVAHVVAAVPQPHPGPCSPAWPSVYRGPSLPDGQASHEPLVSVELSTQGPIRHERVVGGCGSGPWRQPHHTRAPSSDAAGPPSIPLPVTCRLPPPPRSLQGQRPAPTRTPVHPPSPTYTRPSPPRYVHPVPPTYTHPSANVLGRTTRGVVSGCLQLQQVFEAGRESVSSEARTPGHCAKSEIPRRMVQSVQNAECAGAMSACALVPAVQSN